MWGKFGHVTIENSTHRNSQSPQGGGRPLQSPLSIEHGTYETVKDRFCLTSLPPTNPESTKQVGLGFHVNVLETFCVVPSLLESGY